MNGAASTLPALTLLHTHGADPTDAVYARCKQLRHDVFVTEQGYPSRVETESETIFDDSKCDHLIWTTQGEDVGCLRIDSETFKLGRAAVIAKMRGTGLGRKMMNELEEFVKRGQGQIGRNALERRLNQVRFNCDSQTTACKFYERCGWLREGQEYVKEGQPHFSMYKVIDMSSANGVSSSSPSKPVPINSEYSILLCETPEDKQKCLDVRIKVFVEEQKFPLEDEIDDKDDTSDHLLLVQTSSNAPVGTIRFWPPGGKLGRLAVLPQFRTVGAGRMLVESFEAHVKSGRGLGGKYHNEHDLRSVQIVASSQHQVEKFYAKNGYKREGDLYDEDGWPHVRMVKTLQLER
ncbi:hypothetical protein ACM66B_001145 [Microbotryomycetes sp. NB124-2]